MSTQSIKAMGNVGDMAETSDPLTDWTANSGTGTATTLSMTDDERAAAEAARRPIGFVWPAPQ